MFERVKQGVINFYIRGIYQWGGVRVIGFIVLFSIITAFISALWYSANSWYAMLPEKQMTVDLEDFMVILTAYALIFTLLNIVSSFVYMIIMGCLAYWMGRMALMPVLEYARACKLVLISGVPLLTLVLVFGQTFRPSAVLIISVMVVHALWLCSTTLPENPYEEDPQPRL
ncbi:MAG: hypothetical protein MK052_04730 [Alphaproteobacteria bacterium]|nr:hypothetical protein [Alphaproteobacteria bacterium]